MLHHQNGINIIKELKIAKLMRILMMKMKKKSSNKYCMGLRKKKQQSMSRKNYYVSEVVYTKFSFIIFLTVIKLYLFHERGHIYE